MKLYEINQQIENFYLDNVNPETGEIDNVFALERLQVARDEKLEALGVLYKEAMAERSAVKAEILTLNDRKVRAERRAENLKRYLAEQLHGEKFSTSKVDIRFRKSEQLHLSEDAEIPVQFTSVELKVDKQGLKKAIKEGLVAEGCDLVERLNISIK